MVYWTITENCLKNFLVYGPGYTKRPFGHLVAYTALIKIILILRKNFIVKIYNLKCKTIYKIKLFDLQNWILKHKYKKKLHFIFVKYMLNVNK